MARRISKVGKRIVDEITALFGIGEDLIISGGSVVGSEYLVELPLIGNCLHDARYADWKHVETHLTGKAPAKVRQAGLARLAAVKQGIGQRGKMLGASLTICYHTHGTNE